MLNLKNSKLQINPHEPQFFYDYVSGRCLDYVVKLWKENFEPFFAIHTP
jgi:hypothetical protein